MPNTITVTCRLVDTCYPDYVPDSRWVGSSLYGQTAKQMAEEIADDFYENAYSDIDGAPMGDGPFERIKAAVLACIKPDARFWPVDDCGNEITDEDAEIPDEQPSAWFRFDVEVHAMRIKVTCDDKQACDDDQYIDGSSWETPSDLNEGYTSLCDRPTLVEELEAEGYDVDCSCYSAPTVEDMARFATFDGSYRMKGDK